MEFNLVFLFLLYWVSIFSCMGYGIFAFHIVGRKNFTSNYGYIGLLGVLFLIIYSYISNFFYPHSEIHNLALIILGLIFFIYYVLVRFIKKKEFKNLVILFLLLFISFVIYKPHDDFSYYHFQYSNYLIEFPLLIGVGQFNHGFATPSSIFYLNSLFSLPNAKYALFHVPALLLFGFSNLILLQKLLKYLEKNEANYLSFFLLFSIAFINIIFYRLAEHGTDRSAQILVFILIYELIVLINNRNNFINSISKVFLLLSIIISLKAFYLLYFVFLVPVLVFGYIKYKNDLILIFLKNNFFILFVFTFLIIISTNFFNSGCLIFPVSITCFENLPWSFSLDHVNHMNNWYEQWSKAGAGPNFRVDNPEEYILFFNWVSNWFDEYFFNKVSDFLLGLTAIILISSLFIISSKKKPVSNKDKILPIYICLIILFVEWFYNHPSLRYGGYVLLGLFLIISSSLFLEKFRNRKINLRVKTLIILFFGIFILRNVDRINHEIEKYGYRPLENAHYRMYDNYFDINKNLKYLINYHILCSEKKECKDSIDVEMGSFIGKIYFESVQ